MPTVLTAVLLKNLSSCGGVPACCSCKCAPRARACCSPSGVSGELLVRPPMRSSICKFMSHCAWRISSILSMALCRFAGVGGKWRGAAAQAAGGGGGPRWGGRRVVDKATAISTSAMQMTERGLEMAQRTPQSRQQEGGLLFPEAQELLKSLRNCNALLKAWPCPALKGMWANARLAEGGRKFCR